MAMPPWWKIKREFDTLRQQILAAPELLWGPWRKRLKDRRFPADLRVVEGAENVQSKIAIFLIYQPKGIANSVLATCKHLVENGYAVLLVSNTPISVTDQQALQGYVWKFVERVNFGYDFGGYRDGIRLLWQWSIAPESLIILNDSIWFPTRADSQLIRQMEESAAGFVGAIRHVDHPELDSEHGGIFLSYFFLLKKSVLTSATFINYWMDYVPTSNKYLTVRRGERGFSKTLFKAGLASEGIYSRDRFLCALQEQTNEFLAKTIAYGAYSDLAFELEKEALLRRSERGENWRQDVLGHVKKTVAKRNFHSSFCFASMTLLGTPFLKKNTGKLQVRMRHQYVRAVANGDLPSPGIAELHEIKATVQA